MEINQDKLVERNYPSDVEIVLVNGREFILIGTAHISQESTELVRRVIEQEHPDVVCVELDAQRFKTLSEKTKWENLDLKQIIRQKRLVILFVNLLLASYQKRLGQQLGVAPGTELLEATKVAQELDIPLALVDRDVKITLRRAWNSMSFWEKMKLITSGFMGAMEGEEISEEMLSEIRQSDVLSELMNELGEFMPVLKSVLIDERDTYIAQKTRATEGEKVVVVVGAGHMEGIKKTLLADQQVDLAAIEEIPSPSPVGKIIGWGIPAIIIGAIITIGVTQGAAEAGSNLLYWFLVNGIPSAIGAIIALAHPLTIAVSFFGAPLTSLTPVIGAGYVAAFVQAYYQPPMVREFQTVGDDIGQWRMWWRNKLLRVLLVFILTSLGSVIGTYLGAAEIISNLF
ncbi:Pheromone shutdown protein [hydrothermal vent metagenome]|uniref:Pheromone shutdown protein n=1 Tax=hydrothermal vent metagenome TaxID=652676 RepID=A0A3B0UX75_9ZZZZ